MKVDQLAAMKADYWDAMKVGKMAVRRAAY
jgi:hypothetical protein